MSVELLMQEANFRDSGIIERFGNKRDKNRSGEFIELGC